MSIETTTDYEQLARDAAERLQGTCQSLTILLEELGHPEAEDVSAFTETLDAEVFCCDTCGWWCEQSEMSEDEDWVCDDCV